MRQFGCHEADCNEPEDHHYRAAADYLSMVARATYRDILERRAEQNRVDFVNGVATALTPLAFFEIVMNKAFRNLVDDDVEVNVDTGLRAAEKLQAVLDRCDQGDNIAELRLQVYRIQDAVKAVVPQEMWGAIV